MHVDFFDFFRWVLGTVVTIYATVVTAQSAYGWWVYLGSEGKYYSLIRRYVMLQGLRLRIRTFGGDCADVRFADAGLDSAVAGTYAGGTDRSVDPF